MLDQCWTNTDPLSGERQVLGQILHRYIYELFLLIAWPSIVNGAPERVRVDSPTGPQNASR